MPTDPGPHDELDVGRVLVPLDGSEFTLRVLPTARALAGRLGATVHTISVVDEADEADRVRALAAAAIAVAPDDDRVVVVSDPDPATAIARHADALGSSVVCLSTLGRGRFRGAIVGSVARSVIQAADRPVVALGPEADQPGWTPQPHDWPEPLSVPRIVACLDGSLPSEQVLPMAAAWARALDMSMTILTVVEDRPVPTHSDQPGSLYGSHTEPHGYLNALVDRWQDHVPEIDSEVIRDPFGPAGGIRHHLEDRPAGLLAVSTSARSGIERVVRGATAASIIRASVVPCLVLPISR